MEHKGTVTLETPRLIFAPLNACGRRADVPQLGVRPWGHKVPHMAHAQQRRGNKADPRAVGIAL